MRRITATATEIVERVTEVQVPDDFDPTNDVHRNALDEFLRDVECGEDIIERSLTIGKSDGRRRPGCTFRFDDGVSEWTFFGHWENGTLVIEFTLEGDYEDPREGTGSGKSDLWCATGSGTTEAEALAAVRADYEQNN